MAIDEYLRLTGRKAGQFLFAGRRNSDKGPTTRQYARLLQEWVASSAYGLRGSALLYLVVGKRREPSIQNCLRLNPLDPNRATRLLEFAIAHYFERNYEQAAKMCREAIREYPNHRPSYQFLLASLGQLGNQSDCKALVEIAPAGYGHYARHRPPWFSPKDHEHMLEGMRKTGWSE